MNEELTKIGLIPIRSGSKRFPGKNFMSFNNTTLIQNTINKLKEAGVNHIYILSDDIEKPKELFDSKDNGITLIKRPGILSRDESTTDEVINYFLFNTPTDGNFTIVLCQVTSPNWGSHILKYALHKHDYYKHEKTLVSVSPDYKPNGCFYIFTKSKFLKYNKIYSPDLYLVILDWKQCTDIDYEYQLRIAEALDKGDYDEL